jgi:hypothetical protein
MPKRPCAFCPHPATTGEHIWSNWINPLLGKNRRYRISQEIQGTAREWQSVGLHQKFPVLCDDCNNGWGSDIETRTKNACSSMVQTGSLTLLSAQDIVAVAVYSQLKAFVCDYGQQDVESFYDLGMRHAFRSGLTIPYGTSVWLAWTVDYHGVFKSAYAKSPQNTPKRFHSYIFTMSLGQLAIQLTSVRWTKKSNRKYASPPLLHQGGEWNWFSIPIWPNSIGGPIPVSWPPPKQLNREALDAFFHRWHTVSRED